MLEDGRYSVYRVRERAQRRAKRRVTFYKALWVGVTWLCFLVLLAILLLSDCTTWIRVTNCVALTTWSICLRMVENLFIRPAEVARGTVIRGDSPDAVYVLGRDNSAFVLEGTRQQIKEWSTRGLRYGPNLDIFHGVLSLRRTTMDQAAFVLLNVLGQVNLHVGRMLNSLDCLTPLERLDESKDSVICRTISMHC
ncbi:hypothetical protein N657DRAFT_672737 [Parathielavia appendiculata]|uniref:Uncharacterized protein n=1 Tax=Parathielavia appendiculata TaxID=2587402 RepID=A0AAN6TWM0_9PEZI|nr:hypothetical protein N657DRAFT_672737 [Parathielavia appendiculata]